MVFIILFMILALGGRLACSTICPLGILEDLIYKIPFPKKYMQLPYEKQLKKIKYVIFILLVVLIPLVIMPNKELFKPAFLVIKLTGFSTVFLLSLVVYRPFCKYFCPFGVFLGFFNHWSLYRYQVDSHCTKCSYCAKQCPMGLDPYKDPNHMECIRCGKCISSCPLHAISKSKKKTS